MQDTTIQQLIKPYLLQQNKSYLLLFCNGVLVTNIITEQQLPQTVDIKIKGKQLYISIAPASILPFPIHLLFLSTAKQPNEEITSWSNHITVGAGSQATFSEEHIILADNSNICNNVATYLNAKNKAQVTYCKIFNTEPTNSENSIKHDASLHFDLNQESKVETYHFLSSHNNCSLTEKITTKLLEPHATCNNFGLYSIKDKQNLLLDVTVEHIGTDCSSKVLFKGIANDKAQANFFGKITVKEGAQRSKARLDNKNLLLQDSAIIATSPALEIYADDIQCSHGATVGQLDTQALWYLQSRGINPNEAKQILIQAFSQEVLNMFPHFLQEKLKS